MYKNVSIYENLMGILKKYTFNNRLNTKVFLEENRDTKKTWLFYITEGSEGDSSEFKDDLIKYIIESHKINIDRRSIIIMSMKQFNSNYMKEGIADVPKEKINYEAEIIEYKDVPYEVIVNTDKYTTLTKNKKYSVIEFSEDRVIHGPPEASGFPDPSYILEDDDGKPIAINCGHCKPS